MPPKRKSDPDATPSKKAKPAMAFEVGDVLPDMQLLTDEGESVRLLDLVREKGAVIFAYPKANTTGCTKQATGFRDNYADIDKAGYQVFGISADNPKQQANWREKHDLPFTLLCDKSKDGLRALGFMEGAKIKRSHVVVGPGGEVEQYAWGVAPGASVEMATDHCTGGEDEEDE
eukprot:jgi/Ulvmu1/8496/UM044_0030.1